MKRDAWWWIFYAIGFTSFCFIHIWSIQRILILEDVVYVQSLQISDQQINCMKQSFELEKTNIQLTTLEAAMYNGHENVMFSQKELQLSLKQMTEEFNQNWQLLGVVLQLLARVDNNATIVNEEKTPFESRSV